jgi:hypothetical protein
MTNYIIEVNETPAGRVSGLLYLGTGLIAGTADDIHSLETEFREFISTNHQVSFNDITFDH